MNRWLPLSLSAGVWTLAACVTINVYFPAAAAEKAADRIIDDVWGTPSETKPVEQNPSTGGGGGGAAARALQAALDLVFPPAYAQQDPNLDLATPEIARIKAQMENRAGELKPLLANGTVGLGNDGFVAVRDANAVPLAQRNAVRTMVGNENADRAALYREIASANGHKEWEQQIRQVFAQRWIAKAAPGWWYQDVGGAWKQK